ncbi:hypothetical protein TWF225_000007 [Orbilia oligospora]|uniref:Uncharacterized protein n=1 Tax=Orbilia oligospora TaxID=2813651 RepID=A0A7C8P5G5_ORBOL|nr:hypothetical protein TWF751_011747 [Orbilia oligospora]KAF3195601.1 hypothetical protein TWF225_000007 [Orbilia oligospora]KAF3255083.1 hypothetical protein TWF217_006774 [Orbilia oligospora]KAF3255966.1 hypothetical protein TWF128_005419 [Orbilia oligospora]KAF3294142.1 hypothetical protein TWF132_003584 [Orbilia oligospora]
MNFHSCGRSLKLAVNVSRHPSKPRHHHPHYHCRHSFQIIPITNLSTPSSSNAHLHTSSTVLNRTEHPYVHQIDNEHHFDNRYISKEDRDFLWQAKSANLKADVRKRTYSEESIFKPNSYDILAGFSRKHNNEKVRQDDKYDIPPPSHRERHGASIEKSRPKTVDDVVRSGGERDAEKTKNHKQLFAAIDHGFEKGPEDWPATFYLVACAQAYGTLDSRVRTASISYLVKRFVRGGRHNDVIRLYTEIQNSWLPFEQRELDSIEYFKSMFKAFTLKPAESSKTVNDVLKTFNAATSSFQRQYTLTSSSFKQHLTPYFMLFLSTNLSLRESLPAISSKVSQIQNPATGSRLLPNLYSNLNSALLASQKLKPETVNGFRLTSFYKAQSSLLSIISRVPRESSICQQFARVIFSQALTWEEILEGKKLVLDNSAPGKTHEILPLQSALFRSLHRTSIATQPGTQRAKHVVEFTTDLLALTNLRGGPRQLGTSVAVALSLHSNMGTFTAAETLLDKLDTLLSKNKDKSINAPVFYIRDAINNLRETVIRKSSHRRDAKFRAVGIAMRMFELHVLSIQPRAGKGRERIHQGLVRDLTKLLELCDDQASVLRVWEALKGDVGIKNIKLSTIEGILDTLTKTRGVVYAKDILLEVEREGRISPSTIVPFIGVKDMDDWVFDEIVRAGVRNGIDWKSVGYLYQLKRGQGRKSKKVEEWVEAMRSCGDEFVWGKGGMVVEEVMEGVERAFKE